MLPEQLKAPLSGYIRAQLDTNHNRKDILKELTNFVDAELISTKNQLAEELANHIEDVYIKMGVTPPTGFTIDQLNKLIKRITNCPMTLINHDESDGWLF